MNSSAPKKRGAQGRPGARCTRGLACQCICKRNAHEHTGSAEAVRPSLRNGFTAYIVLSPARLGLFVTVIAKEACFLGIRHLPLGRQDHTILPYACAALVSRRLRVHRSPRPTSVTIAIRPSCGCGMARNKQLICPRDQARPLRHIGTTGKSAKCCQVLFADAMLVASRHPEERKKERAPTGERSAFVPGMTSEIASQALRMTSASRASRSCGRCLRGARSLNARWRPLRCGREYRRGKARFCARPYRYEWSCFPTWPTASPRWHGAIPQRCAAVFHRRRPAGSRSARDRRGESRANTAHGIRR